MRLFNKPRSPSQLLGDTAICALYGARNSAIAGCIYASAYGVGLTLGLVGSMALAGAIGAAIIAIPTLAIYQQLARYTFSYPFLNLAIPLLFKTAAAVAAACIGGALIGLAITPFAASTAVAALSFALLNLAEKTIIKYTAPSPETHQLRTTAIKDEEHGRRLAPAAMA